MPFRYTVKIPDRLITTVVAEWFDSLPYARTYESHNEYCSIQCALEGLRTKLLEPKEPPKEEKKGFFGKRKK